MYGVEVDLEGVAPIMFNRIVSLKTGGRKPTEEQEYEAAKERAYRNGAGLYLPARNLKRAFRIGASMAGLKMGRRSIEPYINAAVFIEPAEITFNKENPDFFHPDWVRIPPGKKGALVFKVRPCLNLGWKISPRLTVMDDHIDADNLRIGMENAGLYVGLCDNRPEYGRFIVTKWEVIK